MKIAALQHDIVWEDPAANFRALAPRIAAAAAAGARVVVLSEMYSTGFSMRTAAVAEPPDGPSTAFLRESAARHGIWLCGSVPIRHEDALPHNTCLLAGPDGALHEYRKIHPFTFAREHEVYAAGTRHVTVEVDGLRCSLFVCYDLRFADEFWALAPHTDCYLVVANWPERRRHHWTTLLRARAIENQAYVVGVNRVGRGADLDYVGDSMIVDPWGEVLAHGAKSEALLLAEVDAEVVRQARSAFPVLADRRGDLNPR
jgi:predicted amidohydrolase